LSQWRGMIQKTFHKIPISINDCVALFVKLLADIDTSHAEISL
jgi:hypothetical protein